MTIDAAQFSKFRNHCFFGEMAQAKKMLDDGFDIHGRNHQGLTPLHAAAEGSLLGVVDLLLAAGVDVNPRCALQTTPLHTACCFGGLRFETVKRLLDAGADPTVRNLNGLTPIECDESGFSMRYMRSKAMAASLEVALSDSPLNPQGASAAGAGPSL